jgi:hypothetical protein
VDQFSERWSYKTRERFEQNCALVGFNDRSALRSSGWQRVERIRDEILEATARFNELRNDILRASDDGMPGEVDGLLRQEIEFVFREVLRSAASEAAEAVRRFADCVMALQHRLLVHADLLRQYTAIVITEIRDLLNSVELFGSKAAVPWLRDPLVQNSIRACEQVLAEHANVPDPWNCETLDHYDSFTWPAIVQQWEEFKAAEEIEPGWDHGIEESDLRTFICALSEGKPSDVTWDQLRSAAGALCQHYGSAVLTTSVSYPPPEMIEAVAGAVFWKEREDEFRKHDVHENRALEAIWHSGDDGWRLQMQSKTEAPGSESKGVFTSLARQAGKGLSGPHRDDLFLRWLDALKQHGCGRDSVTGSATISDSRAEELRISDELVSPRCGLWFHPASNRTSSGDTSATREYEDANGFRVYFVEEHTNYLIEDVFRTSANLCLELRSRSIEPETGGPTDVVLDRRGARANDGDEAPRTVMIRPENRPLPELPPAALQEIKTARARAQAKLLDDLNDCWTEYFPVNSARKMGGPNPERFFGPFVTYGVALYDAFGRKLLELQPNLSDYLDWINFRLKINICDEIAPLWSAEQLKESASLLPRCQLPYSEWENSMRHSWHVFDHPQHNALEGEARKLIPSLRDPLDNHWEQFLSLLNNAMSRKTPHWRAEGVERLENSAASKETPGVEEEFCKPERTAAEQPAARPDGGEQDNTNAVSWDAIEISFLSDERVQIFNGSNKETLNYSEMGFADGRTGAPKQAWAILRALAEARGTIPDAAKGGQPWPKVEKRVQEIRKTLRGYFNIASDPIPFVEGTGYRACFKIGCSPSFHM